MHELGLAENTLTIALDEARRQNARQILAMRLRVGALSGVVPEALQFALETIIEDTPAAGARIQIDRIIPVCYCNECRSEFEVHDYSYACPACGNVSLDLRCGKEMDLISLEVA